MKESVKIEIALPQDRDAVVTILARNGYTVRQTKVKKGKAYVKYVEFWKEGDNGEAEEIRSST
jgi:hypothetical protein